MTAARPGPFVAWLPQPPTGPAPARDRPRFGAGPLAGVRLAVKDVIDVAGLPTGAGHPRWLATHPAAVRDAEAVSRLRAAGALVVGKTHTDELAYSLGGTSAHYGAVPNPAAPGRVSGGSSSGTAAAVAAGHADLGLGTDTAGSIRVPASYCGLYGFRPSHRRAPRAGIVPLAPSFDVPGLLARDPAVLDAGLRALLGADGPDARRSTGDDVPAGSRPVRRLLVPDDLWSHAGASVTRALGGAVATLTGLAPVDRRSFRAPDAPGWERTREAFAAVQAAEAWAAHGDWITEHRPEFGPGVGARFAAARAVTAERAELARTELAAGLAPLLELLHGGDLLVLPAAPGPAPRLTGPVHPPEVPADRRTARGPAAPDRRAATVLLTCLASAAGAPALCIPAARLDGAPLGLCLVAAPGSDEQLLDLLAVLAPALTQGRPAVPGSSDPAAAPVPIPRFAPPPQPAPPQPSAGPEASAGAGPTPAKGH
ncbi:amidase family protein [Kitasatospora sp. NPDC057015]|uniref:amidase family protein n=1 Tax=Kitasatospora sp. NPDC057015 TaxID=3346001 RepID=UPI0036253902